jgi:hypothetical protein
MRSFRQIANSIIGMIENPLHRVSVEEILPAIREASEANKRESPGQHYFQFDSFHEECVLIRIWNRDAGFGSGRFETMPHVLNCKVYSREVEEESLKWISNSLSRLLDLQGPCWFLVKRSQLINSSDTSVRRIAGSAESGLVSVKRGVYRVRGDMVSEYVKPDERASLRPFVE